MGETLRYARGANGLGGQRNEAIERGGTQVHHSFVHFQSTDRGVVNAHREIDAIGARREVAKRIKENVLSQLLSVRNVVGCLQTKPRTRRGGLVGPNAQVRAA